MTPRTTVVAAVFLVVALAGLVTFEYAAADAERANIERYAHMLEPYLWNLDVEQATATAQLLVNTEEYQSLEIRHADESGFVAVTPSTSPFGGPLGQLGFAPTRTVEMSLVHDTERIGTLIVHYPYRNATTHGVVLLGLMLLLLAGTLARRSAEQRRELEAVKLELERRHRRQVEVKLSEREQQLRESQRLEALGRFAAGVAHDFNNILTAILASADLVAEQTSEQVTRDRAETITSSAERAAALTAHLLAFGRQQVLEPQVLQINAVVTKMQDMLQRLIGDEVTLESDLADGIGAVRADPSQIERILLNLVVNANDAMPTGGTVRITTREVEQEGESRAVLSVIDEGVGMSEETRQRMFEPFYSAKAGGGTGLGLSTVHGIVHQSGGEVWVQSELGEGTTVQIALPIVRQRVTPTGEGVVAVPVRTPGRILVVEDMSDVRVLLCEALRTAGYDVLEAESGAEALKKVSDGLDSIDIMVTDVSMPGMNGKELADTLRHRRPDLPVLFMSGYAADALPFDYEPAPHTALMQKPFRPQALLERVDELVRGVTTV